LARAFFLLWLLKPISWELVKEEYPLSNRIVAKKSTAYCQDLQPDLAAFARPVRIIFGAEDPYLNPGVARFLHEALPTSDLALLAKKGHWPQLDGASEVAQLLLSIPEV